METQLRVPNIRPMLEDLKEFGYNIAYLALSPDGNLFYLIGRKDWGEKTGIRFLRGRKVDSSYDLFSDIVLRIKLELESYNEIAKRIAKKIERRYESGSWAELLNVPIPTYVFPEGSLFEALDKTLEGFGPKKPFDELYNLQKKMLETPVGVV